MIKIHWFYIKYIQNWKREKQHKQNANKGEISMPVINVFSSYIKCKQNLTVNINNRKSKKQQFFVKFTWKIYFPFESIQVDSSIDNVELRSDQTS